MRASYLAARGKRARPDVAAFLYDYEFHLLRLQRQLMAHTYRPGAYYSFFIYEPKRFLAGLRLKLHEDKSVIFPVTEGIPFLGYRVFPDHRLLGKANIKLMQRRIRKMQRAFAAAELPIEKITERIQCWIAHAEHADTFHLRKRLLDRFPFCQPGAGRDETDFKEFDQCEIGEDG